MKKINISMIAHAEAINQAEIYRGLREMIIETAKEYSHIPIEFDHDAAHRADMRTGEDTVNVIGKLGFADFKIKFRAHEHLMAVELLVYRKTIIPVPSAQVPEVKHSSDAVDKVIKALFTVYSRDPARIKHDVAKLEQERDARIKEARKSSSKEIEAEYAAKIERAKKTTPHMF